MRKIASVLLVTAILMSMLIPVSATENSIQPYYINTNQARVLLGIDEDGLADISIFCTAISATTQIKTTTYLERLVGSTWVRVSIGQTNNQWSETVSTRYIAKNYSYQLSIKGQYRAVTVFTVTATETETFTLYCEATY